MREDQSFHASGTGLPILREARFNAMDSSRQTLSAYVFGPFRLRVRDRILERDGARVQLTPKVVDTLFVLVENYHQMVSKEDLMKAVWPDVTVVESGLTRNISILRKALEAGVADGTYIETIPRRGYRFVAEVTEKYGEDADEHDREHATAPHRAVSMRAPRRTWLVRWWPTVAAVTVVALASLLLFRPTAPAPPRTVEPRIRIGEYLLYQLAPEQSARAAEQFEQEISARPHSAAAHAGLAISLLQMAALGIRTLPDVAPRADAEAKQALELDASLHTAHYATALSKFLYHRRFDEAEKSFLRALELDPASVQSRLGYTHLKFAKGEIGEAIRLTEEALRLDPASPLLGARYCQSFYFARDFHRAEAECRKVLEREPHFTLARYYLGLSLGWQGRTAEARRSFDGINMGPGVIESDEAWLSLREGDRRPANALLDRRRELIRQGKMAPPAKLLLCAILGEVDEAFEAVEASIVLGAFEVLTFKIDPRLDALRNDLRYPEVLRRIGVTPGA